MGINFGGPEFNVGGQRVFFDPERAIQDILAAPKIIGGAVAAAAGILARGAWFFLMLPVAFGPIGIATAVTILAVGAVAAVRRR